MFLVGKNNIGKSSVLEALDVVFNKTTFNQSDITIGKANSDVLFELDFKDRENSQTIIRTVSVKVLDDLSVSKTMIEEGNVVDATEFLQGYDFSLFPAVNYSNSLNVSSIRGLTVRELFNQQLDSIKDYPKYKEIKNCWTGILGTYLYSNATIGGQGTGLRRLLALFMFVIDCIKNVGRTSSKQIIVAIEEPEIALFPEQQRILINNLVDVFRYLDVQMFVTTHSPFIVKELASDLDKVVVLRKNKNKSKISSRKLDNRLICIKIPDNPDYLSANEINYIAFEENSVDYHIELFGYLYDVLKANSSSTGVTNSIESVDTWLSANGVPNANVWYDTRYIVTSNPGHPQPENRTLPHCVRNNIDHPLIKDDPSNTLYHSAYENNKKYAKLQEIEKSIEILRKVIKDNSL